MTRDGRLTIAPGVAESLVRTASLPGWLADLPKILLGCGHTRPDTGLLVTGDRVQCRSCRCPVIVMGPAGK